MATVQHNKKAFFDYEILEEYEGGISLLGPEIKAIRANRVTIAGSYIKPFISNGATELWWVGSNFHVAEGDATRTKKILLHRSEIRRIAGKLASGNYTIVPLDLFLHRGFAKLRLAIASRRKKHDKRAKLKEKAIKKTLRQQTGL